ncbi:solute carrier family 22 member 6-A-like [Arapaima gigas]
MQSSAGPFCAQNRPTQSCSLSVAMGFAEILDEIGGFGRFQLIHVALLSVPGLLMASQNLLNNFTAGMPGHHCAIPNRTSLALVPNLSLSPLSDTEVLRAFIPTVDGWKLSKCRRYREAQWHLVGANRSIAGGHSNGTGAATETCEDGWTYEKTEFLSTIVTEVNIQVQTYEQKQEYRGGRTDF